ncbi:inovirus-type Gp2 protein [Thiomicrorhabdus sp. 6S3-12]|uniref:YagK/YfjJ domain-containing protein n=1 Tax=Thiomicrorhabdus sp. 6S3-12 TaxID=2819681 RepID=UPI001AACC9DD|nr:inovirus-type Gp2 protein [Thiomicrorhabdus sp. 6S3-12]MBO1923782.1 inovirus Gp2 family protein [Thiomicrorhabdus sp. 6S3-12]
MNQESKNEFERLKRHKDNSNLKLLWDCVYMGYGLMSWVVPFVEQYIEVMLKVIVQHVFNNNRTLAIRFELCYPPSYQGDVSNKNITQFFKGVKYRTAKQCVKSKAGRKHETDVNYFWVKEQDGSDYPHYHVLLLLNYDAYRGLGKYDSRESLFGFLRLAWAGALGIEFDETKGGVVSAAKYKGIDESRPIHVLKQGESDFIGLLGDLIFRASYMCKAATKVYKGRERSFGSSLINSQ